MVEPIGLFTFLAGAACIALGPSASIYALLISSLLGAAAAAILTFMGSANVPPAHVLLGFIALQVLFDRRYFAASLEIFHFPRPGFWLLATGLYGLVATIFMPRLFAGQTNVFAIARTGEFGILALVPLAPVSGNITQTIYFAADIVCFAVFYAFARDSQLTQTFAKAGIACAITNLAFGALDVLSYATNTTDFLSVLRNASYTMLYETELAGFKRIVGSFTEASAYAATTLWLLAFVARLWLSGIRPVLTGFLSALLLIALIFATSTTGYVGFAVYAGLEYARSLRYVFRGSSPRPMVAFVMLAPVGALTIIFAMALHESIWATVQDVIQITIIDKTSSASGVERATWNRQALLNVVETAGLGVGIGSTRTSSWLLAVPVNLGIIGALTYLTFIAAVLFSRTSSDPFAAAVQGAARGACLALLITAIVGGAFIDLGLPFFIFAGVSIGLQPLSQPEHFGIPTDTISGQRVDAAAI